MTEGTGTGRTCIAAHRAGAALWPENSMTAFRNALAMPVEFIEFDVHRSRDGVLVVHHDPALGRTVEGEGAIGDLDWAVLRAAPVRGAPGERMLMLAEVLPLFDDSPVRPRLELKTDARDRVYPGMTADVMAMLRACGLRDRTVVTSFEPACLDEARAAGAPHVLWLLDRDRGAELAADVGGFCRAALARGFGELAVRGADATPELVAECRDHGMVLGAFAGRDLDFDRLLGIGLSVFTSDRPDLALAARGG